MSIRYFLENEDFDEVRDYLYNHIKWFKKENLNYCAKRDLEFWQWLEEMVYHCPYSKEPMLVNENGVFYKENEEEILEEYKRLGWDTYDENIYYRNEDYITHLLDKYDLWV